LAGLAIAFPVLGAILALALVLAVIGLWRRLTRKRARAATVVDAP
jgi:flagellar biogenesis protein FliO